MEGTVKNTLSGGLTADSPLGKEKTIPVAESNVRQGETAADIAKTRKSEKSKALLKLGRRGRLSPLSSHLNFSFSIIWKVENEIQFFEKIFYFAVEGLK